VLRDSRLAEVSSSPARHIYVLNNPVTLIDPSGKTPARRRGPSIRCKLEIHPAHHYFGWPFNRKMCHLQLICWTPGKKGPQFILRIPWPCRTKS
jgi:hypothetical protein